MKQITTWQRLAIVSLLLGTLAAGISVFTLTKSAVGSLGHPVTNGPLGVIETDGTLDSSFNPGRFTNGLVTLSALQPDGKLLIAGAFSEVHGVPCPSIARLNTDGTLDLSFVPGIGTGSSIQTMILQADGKIVICGGFQTTSGVSKSMARLNSDGSYEFGFDPNRVISFDGLDDGKGNAIFPGQVYAAVLQADGKFVVTGQFFYIITGPGTNVTRSCVARFNSDGTFDSSYDPGAGAVQSDNPTNGYGFYAVGQSLGTNSGKVIIQGYFDTFDGHPVPGLVRLNADGSFDPTFTLGATNNFGILGLFVQSDDKLFVFGIFTSFNGVPCSSIVRLDTSGVVDSGFNTAAFEWYGTETEVFGVAQQPDGKLIVTGAFHSLGGVTANNVVRLETNGARDASFSGIGAGPSAWHVTTALVRPSDGKVFFGGYFSTFGGELRNNIAWANPDGSLDSSFAGLAGVTEYEPNIWALGTQTDGKIVMTGLFTAFNGASHNNILRLNPDASIDPSFDVNTDRSTRALIVQPDGKILIAGFFREINGVPAPRIARLNSDGTLDPSFDPGMGPDNYIYALAQDSEGNIYAGGVFQNFNGVPRPAIAKLNSSGALDPTFNPTSDDKEPFVFAIAPPDDTGGIVIGGQFSSFSGTSAHRIARLNATTGALDPDFNTGGGFSGNVYVLRLTPDGKYYAGGNFNTYNGVTRRRIARLNSNGSLDTTFSGPTLDGTVYTIVLQNGKVFAGGTNTSGKVVRLTSSGALDATFVTGTGFDISPVGYYHAFFTKISALALQADGKLLVGGIFNQYNGTPRSCLARLTGPIISPTPTPTPTPTPSPAQALNLSTRMLVQTGDNIGIGGFIITGSAPKQVVLRAIGPSLAPFGIPNVLSDPVLELHGPAGFPVYVNDNWRDTQDPLPIIEAGLAPTDDRESALLVTIDPGAYTAVVKGINNTTGIGLVEVYDLGPVSSQLANISTRAYVGTGGDVVIGGFILAGGNNTNVVIRGIGPSLGGFGIPNPLADPTLELRDNNGALLASNDNCQGSTLPPTDPLESCIEASLSAGAYTAILAGKNGGTGVGLVEIYNLQ